jgi:hypothetical protein
VEFDFVADAASAVLELRSLEPNNAGGIWVDEVRILEQSADCDADGSPDWEQIVAGDLQDSDGDFVPDCCEEGVPCPANLAVNGSFEAGAPLPACSVEIVASGSGPGTGWIVTHGSVERARASIDCHANGSPRFGDFYVDLLDSGELCQSVATTPGRSYRLSFWLSGDCASGPTPKRVTAALGASIQTFDHACVGTAAQAWRRCAVEFIASAAVTTVSLKSAAGGTANGPLVDGVRVEDVSISCPGDVDGDGQVGGGDVGLVLLNFGDCPTN